MFNQFLIRQFSTIKVFLRIKLMVWLQVLIFITILIGGKNQKGKTDTS